MEIDKIGMGLSGSCVGVRLGWLEEIDGENKVMAGGSDTISDWP